MAILVRRYCNCGRKSVTVFKDDEISGVLGPEIRKLEELPRNRRSFIVVTIHTCDCSGCEEVGQEKRLNEWMSELIDREEAKEGNYERNG